MLGLAIKTVSQYLIKLEDSPEESSGLASCPNSGTLSNPQALSIPADLATHEGHGIITVSQPLKHT